MFLPILTWFAPLVGFPRVRGDVPPAEAGLFRMTKFSPRARGCSLMVNVCSVCPCSFPRVRGDVPTIIDIMQVLLAFSPRARGCSHQFCRAPANPPVFPACAGMFRYPHRVSGWGSSFPRVRGDVPPLRDSS